MKVLGCTSWRGEAISLAGKGLLVYRDMFNFLPLDNGTNQLHLEFGNFS